MNKYESVIIVNPNLDDDKVKALQDEVKKQKEGIYVTFYFEAAPELISELERNYRISDDVIKFIVIKVEE